MRGKDQSVGSRPAKNGQNQPEAVVLAILGDFDAAEPPTVARRLVEKLCAPAGPNEKRQREYLAMLEILVDNRHLTFNLQETCAMLQFNLERLPSYQMGLEKGMEKGLEQGAHRKALAIAETLLAMNLSPEQIAAITQLPLAEIPKKAH